MNLTRKAAGIGLGVVGVILAGSMLLLSGGVAQPPSDGIEQRQATPEQVTAENTFSTPAEAAVAKAADVGMEDAGADRFIVIFADEHTVDLRVRVNGDGCAWFGIGGFVQDGKLRWTHAGSGAGQPC